MRCFSRVPSEASRSSISARCRARSVMFACSICVPARMAASVIRSCATRWVRTTSAADPRPAEANRADVLEALTDASAANSTAEAEARLAYLRKPLGLTQLSPSETKVKIVLDTVAEYLAALHVTDYCQKEDSDERWQQFFETVDADPSSLGC